MTHPYRIFETSAFLDDLKRLPPTLRRKIEAKLSSYAYPQIKGEPHFGPNIKKLRDWEPETWRYRIGPWRAFYEINDREQVVYMLTFDWRKDAY